VAPLGALHLFCGKLAAGKSTLAAKIAKDANAYLLPEDRPLAAQCPNQIKSLEDYLRFSALI
jgi:shikimate kinase